MYFGRIARAAAPATTLALVLAAGCSSGDGSESKSPEGEASTDTSSPDDTSPPAPGGDIAGPVDDGGPETAVAPDPAYAHAHEPSDVLYAGVGEAELGFPVGTATVGLSPKKAATTPYAESYPGTDTRHTDLTAKALVLRREGKVVALVRTDTIGIWQDIVRDVQSALRAQGRGDLADGLVVGATHTHGSGGRVFDHFIGEIAVGAFLGPFYERVRNAVVEAVLEADDAAVPAEVGHGALQVPGLHKDRRCENGDVIDDTMGLIKVVDAGGALLAVVVNYAAHGTVVGHGDWVLTSDASGAIEAGIEAALPDAAAVLYLQSWAGDMAPDAPESVFEPEGKDLRGAYRELMGMAKHAAEEVIPGLEAIETIPDPVLDVVTLWFPVDGKEINADGSFDKYRYGGIYCVPDTDNCEGPDQILYTADHLACFGVPEDLTIFSALMSAVRIGDLGMVTLPGEPLTSLGVELRDRAKEATGLSDVYVLGYAQGYLAYLLHPDDYYLGGYEANGSIMGPHFGQYLVDTGVGIAGRLTDPVSDLGFEPVDVPWADPTSFGELSHEGALGEPTIEDEPAAEEGILTARWVGGDPAVDFPVVTLLEVDNAGDATPATHPSGQVIDSHGLEMELGLSSDPSWSDDIKADARTWYWTLRMAAQPSVVPAGGHLEGTYRLHIEGTRPEAYSLESADFTLP